STLQRLLQRRQWLRDLVRLETAPPRMLIEVSMNKAQDEPLELLSLSTDSPAERPEQHRSHTLDLQPQWRPARGLEELLRADRQAGQQIVENGRRPRLLCLS